MFASPKQQILKKIVWQMLSGGDDDMGDMMKMKAKLKMLSQFLGETQKNHFAAICDEHMIVDVFDKLCF